MQNNVEIVRVSSQVFAWLDDPSSVPEHHPHCQWCGTPKVDRRSRCEVCKLYGSVSGPLKTGRRVFIESYKPRRTVKLKRQK